MLLTAACQWLDIHGASWAYPATAALLRCIFIIANAWVQVYVVTGFLARANRILNHFGSRARPSF